MSANPISESPPRPGKGRLRILKVLIFVGALPILIVIGGLIYSQSKASRTLSQAVAAADRLDPGWRLADLERDRAVVPDAENSAKQVQAALDELPRGWLDVTPAQAKESSAVPRGGKLLDSLGDEPAAVPLSPEQIEGLRAELAAVGPALKTARALSEMPRGRFPLVFAPVYQDTALTHAQETRKIARLLRMDALLRAHDGDSDGALDSCRALLNSGRALGDEPIIITQLVRMAIEGVTLDTLQRTLARGEASDAALSKMQALLADEAAQPLLLYALRGERAGSFDMYGKLATGAINVAQLSGAPAAGPSPGAAPYHMKLFFYYNQGLTLDYLTRAVEIAKRPLPEQNALWKEWEQETKRPPGQSLSMLAGTLTYLLLPAMTSVGQANHRSRASLHAGQLLVALERQRRTQGEWPKTLAAIDPAILPNPPVDPYNGEPFRYARRADGIVVYSVGPDGKDDGGKFDPKFRTSPGTDLGFRLGNPDRRKPRP